MVICICLGWEKTTSLRIVEYSYIYYYVTNTGRKIIQMIKNVNTKFHVAFVSTNPNQQGLLELTHSLFSQ